MIKSDAPSSSAVGSPGGDALIGRTLNGRFSITDAIGAGGMGKVYRAMQAPLDRVVALKVLDPSFPSTKDPGFQQRFLREASLTSKLRHPNTVTVIDYGQTEDGIYYIAMEYLEGRTLGQLLSQVGPLPWSRVIAITQQVCRSLREAHGLGIVHRDLKPANIMLLNEADQDLVKVLDFGLVKSIGSAGDAEAPQQLSPEITQSGTFLGSPQYMAPEQARNVADARSDIYSLGVVMYQMLQGRPPFIARDHLELIFAHYKEAPPPFSSLRPHIPVPPEIEAVVMKCLEKDPARRYQSMDEMLEAMRQANMAAGGQSGVFKRPGGATTGPHASPSFVSNTPQDTNASTLALDISVEVPESVARERRRKLMAMGLVGGAVVVGLVATLVLMRPKEAPPATPPAAVAAVAPAAPAAPVTPPPPAPEPAQAAPQMVRFRLMSEPAGAKVYYLGKERGTTPFVLEIPAGGDGTVTAELTFWHEGYQPETVMTGGSGDVVLSQKLQKRRGGMPGSGKVEFARAPSLEPAPSMATSLNPAESLAPPTPVPTAAPAAKAASPSDDAVPAGVGAAVPMIPANVLASAGNKPLPYGEGMSRPEQLDGKEIAYTREALAARIQGTMLVKCTITKAGRVENCRVLKPLPHMEQAVLEALTSRVYKPILYQGQAVAVDYVFNLKLALPKR